jgi:hypothetical protein
MNPIFLGKIDKGNIILRERDKFYLYLRSMDNQEVEVIVRRPRRSRTDQQNRWYWACVVGIPAEHFGYTVDEMHESFKYLFLRRPEEPGKPVTMRSTTDLSTKGFTEYVEKCRQWCAEQNIVIPDPDQVDYEEKEV